MTDRFPAEIWIEIVTHACTDGGATGRALSLTCRFLHHVVQPLRFHSIALLSAARLHAFSAHLASLTASESPPPPPPIAHLLVSVPIRHFGIGAQSAEERAALHAAWAVVLAHAAPTLRTLFVHAPPSFDPASAQYAPVPLTFPALTALTVPGLDVDAAAGRFPRVHDMHIARAFHAPLLWDPLARSVPRARRVRLSGIANANENAQLGAFLRVLLGVPAPEGPLVPPPLRRDVVRLKRGSAEEAKALEVRKALTELEGVWVQMHHYEALMFDVARRYEAVVAGLERVVWDCERDGRSGRVVWLPDGKPAYEVEEATKDWLDYIAGGDGPWRVPKAQVEDVA